MRACTAGAGYLNCLWMSGYDSKAMEPLMTLQLNGEAKSVPVSCSVQDLIRFLGIAEERIAVEVNRGIVRRADWGGTVLRGGDRVEIVQFVGGG
jgi:sulfur carrier protein